MYFMYFLRDAIPLFFNIEIYVFTSITQQKKSRYKTNYILVNAWRHVSAVLTAIFRPTCSTDQVRAIFLLDLYHKLA